MAAPLVDAPDSFMLVVPSDHVITTEAAFHAATDALVQQVRDGWLAAFGINPTGPEIGYAISKWTPRLGRAFMT